MIVARNGFQIHWPDKREALVHMTKNPAPRVGFPNNDPSRGMNALDRLCSILTNRVIRASWVNHMDFLRPHIPTAVGFSEALSPTIQIITGQAPVIGWHGMMNNYAPYGIMVHKESVLMAGGGPVWYVHNEEFKALTGDPLATHQRQISPDLRFLLSPLAPSWSNLRSHPTHNHPNGVPIDWTQEREWRTPNDFHLPLQPNGNPDYFVIVGNQQDVQRILGLGVHGLQQGDIIVINQLPNIW